MMKQLFQENRNTFLLLFVLLFILVLSVYFFLYRPLAAELQHEEKQEQVLKDEVAILDERLSTIPGNVEESTKDLEYLRLKDQLPTLPELDEFLLTLNEIELISNSRINEMTFGYQGELPERGSIGDEKGIEDVTDEFTEAVDESMEGEEFSEPELILEMEEMPIGLESIIVTIDVQSPDYEHFQLFLKEIENQERMMVVSSLEFDKPTESEIVFAENPDETILARIVVMTFYYDNE